MQHSRPDPDELLKELKAQEEQSVRGKLKIFLGASAGVGKTYAMLSEAHEQRERGVDVVAGYVETHGRKETDALLRDLEILPLREIEYKGVKLKEFDIDAALERHPQLLLVDELAHTNAPGSRHPKRYLDVEELLRSGIDVYTAINIQHLETLNDVVAQITGTQVRETVPDSVFASADEVELVDIPPKELLRRLQEGKVYMPEQAEQAMERFFREGNLIALRELALRKTADRVDAQMQSYRSVYGVSGTWPTKERMLICVAPNRMATRLVRFGKRMADSMHADVLALYVESDRQAGRAVQEQEKARRALVLAESLGMETVHLGGHDIVNEVLRFAQKRNVTQIIVGKPIKPRWRELLFGSVVDEMVRHSGDINVHVITGETEASSTSRGRAAPARSSWRAKAETLLVVTGTTLFCWLCFGFLKDINLVMIYLLGIAFVSSRYGPQEAALSAALSVAAFDFFFVEPRFTFSVSDSQYIVTFAVMLGVGLLISSLAQAMRANMEATSNRERRTSALYALSRKLVKSRSKKEIAESVTETVQEVLDCDATILLPDDGGRLSPVLDWKESQSPELGVAEWSFQHGQPAGIGTDTLPGSQALYLPLLTTIGTVGVLGIRPRSLAIPLDATQKDLVSAFANQAALAIERATLAKESHNARMQAETERMRNSLLSSVSHDLRTPLTSITGAASTLLNELPQSSPLKELAETIYEESDRLTRLVRNLLDMSRVESGQLVLNREWNSLEELIGSSLARTKAVLKDHHVSVHVSPDLPLARVDGVLIEQVLVNLLENAARHTPKGTDIEVRAGISAGFIRVEVSDNGPGLPKGDEDRIFEKFFRGTGLSNSQGFGLGLAISRPILQAHGAQLWAKQRPGGGAMFVFELKIERAPEVPVG